MTEANRQMLAGGFFRGSRIDEIGGNGPNRAKLICGPKPIKTNELRKCAWLHSVRVCHLFFQRIFLLSIYSIMDLLQWNNQISIGGDNADGVKYHWLHDRSTCDSVYLVIIFLFTETAATSSGTTNYLYFNRSLYIFVLLDLCLFSVIIFREYFK